MLDISYPLQVFLGFPNCFPQFRFGFFAHGSCYNLSCIVNRIGDDKTLENQMRNEMESRKSSSSQYVQLSFEECRTFFQSSFSVQSWTCVRRDEIFFPLQDQLPLEMWGEILAYLTNDATSLHESFLVLDLRSGFFFPFPICRFSLQETPLLSMIPLIEGLFRQDRWTIHRLHRFGLHGMNETDNNRMLRISCQMIHDDELNGDDRSARDSCDGPLLKRVKTS